MSVGFFLTKKTPTFSSVFHQVVPEPQGGWPDVTDIVEVGLNGWGFGSRPGYPYPMFQPSGTRWAPTSYKWSYNPTYRRYSPIYN